MIRSLKQHTWPSLFAVITFAYLLSPVRAVAQTHQATVSWSAPTDAVAGSTYNVYRTASVCPISGIGTLTWTKLNSTGLTALTYTDSTLTVGNWCYYVTQVQSTIESAPSNTGGGQAKPNSVTIQIVIN